MNGSRQRNRRQNTPRQEDAEIKRIVEAIGRLTSLNNLSANDLIQYAKTISRQLGGEEVKTQLYKVLATFRRLEREFKRSGFQSDKVRLLTVGLVWAASRHQKLNSFFPVMDAAINKVNNDKDFDKLVRFVEAIVAYNAYKGPTPSEQREGESA